MARIATWTIVILLCLAMAAGVFIGGPPPTASGGGAAGGAAGGVSASVTPLSAAAKARHENMREVVAHLLTEAGGDPSNLSSVENKLAAVQTILDAADPATRSSWELRCLATVFADAVVQGQGLEWVAVRDAEGHHEALAVPDSDLMFLPRDIFVDTVRGSNPIHAQALYDAIQAELNQSNTQ